VLALVDRRLTGLGLVEEGRTLVVGLAIAPVRGWRYNVQERWLAVRYPNRRVKEGRD
jgi:hypothetical protein